LNGILFKAIGSRTESSKDLGNQLQKIVDHINRLSENAEKKLEYHKQRVQNAEKRHKTAKEAAEAIEKEYKKRQRAHGTLKSGETIKRKRFSIQLQVFVMQCKKLKVISWITHKNCGKRLWTPRGRCKVNNDN
jgi:chromosome segregation ATPase